MAWASGLGWEVCAICAAVGAVILGNCGGTGGTGAGFGGGGLKKFWKRAMVRSFISAPRRRPGGETPPVRHRCKASLAAPRKRHVRASTEGSHLRPDRRCAAGANRRNHRGSTPWRVRSDPATGTRVLTPMDLPGKQPVGHVLVAAQQPDAPRLIAASGGLEIGKLLSG